MFSKRRISRLLVGLSIFLIISGNFSDRVSAATSTLFEVQQVFPYLSGSISQTSKEGYINDLTGIDYLTVNMANSEHHWYCGRCGGRSTSSTTKLSIYGYTKEDDTEELLKTFSVSGTDGTSTRKATYQVKLTDSIKQKYGYLKVTATLSGIAADTCSCTGSGGYYSNGVGYANVTAQTFDNPIIQTNGDLSDKVLVEGMGDYIGSINAYFPGGSPQYRWQYSEGETWVTLIDKTSAYNTGSHGTLILSDDKGGYDFSKSSMIKLDNPEVNMTGLKFRAILLSGTGTDDAISQTATITVNSKDISSFSSVRFASRYGQVGEKITTNDIISFVEFNNGQIADTDKLRDVDKRVEYYGFVAPDSNAVSGLTESRILSGMSDGTIRYSELSMDDNNLIIKEGSNKFYVKLAYQGLEKKSIFAVVKFDGKDEVPPQFSENAALYESDGVTLYSGNDYEISDAQLNQRLIIKGDIRDTVSDGNSISWAYTLTNTKNPNNEIGIPVYRKGNEIEINVNCNGKYTLMAEDSSGNVTSKVITVKAYDESNPVMNVSVNANGGEEGVCKGYTVEIDASDAEKLHRKPYLIKRFDTAKAAGEYAISLADESDFSSINTRSLSRSGYYLIVARDAVGKIVTEVTSLPRPGETIDASNPEVMVTPVPVKDSSGEMTEYNIYIFDNNAISNLSVRDSEGMTAVSKNHAHTDECKQGSCVMTHHFNPEKEGKYTVTATDMAGNVSTAYLTVSVRTVESVEVTDLPDSMSVNSEINVKGLIDGSRILLKMSDGTTDVYSGNKGIDLECTDANGRKIDKLLVGYGENTIHFKVTINKGTDKEKSFEFAKTIVGEDNVAPLPGEFCSSFSEGWDGSLTNDLSKQVVLKANGYEDDGSEKGNLVITWYKDGAEVQKKSSKEGGEVYGPFSGEEANGTYKYTITDEKGNFCNSTFEKIIDCWDTTPPAGEVRLLPDGVSESSKARYKQIQIVNASDDRSIAEKPYSFKGNKEESYSVVGSLVAGENDSYEIYLRDACGNVTHLQDLTLSGIDSVAPTINRYEIKDGDEGKTILHVDAYDTDSEGKDNSGKLQYSIDGNNYQESPDFEIDKSGVYTIYVKDDTGNITRTGTDYTDTDKPEIKVYQDETGAGVIIIEASDNVGLSRIVMEGPDGSKEILQVYDGASVDTVRKDIGKIGTYTIIATDLSGNSVDAQVNIESIKAACNSSILSGLKVTPEGYTSGDVTVIAQLVDTNGLSSSPFRWNGSIPTAQPYVIMTENGTATVEICDKYGNSIVSDSITVSNIDRTSPVMDELVQSEDKNHVVVKVTDTGSGISQITISGGPYSVEMSAVKLNGEKNPDSVHITLPTNGTYTVRAYDLAGNSCQRQITAEGVTTDVAKMEVREKIVKVDNVITEEKVVTQDRIVTQTVETPVPVLVPVPTPEYITKYKYLRDEGEDTTKYIRGEDIEGKDKETVKENNNEIHDKETVTEEVEMAYGDNKEIAMTGERTADGTYIAPDGYEYYGRVDKDLKKNHPLKYWFKVNAEKIAIAMCIMALILLALCITMGVMLAGDYIKEQKDKNVINKLSGK